MNANALDWLKILIPVLIATVSVLIGIGKMVANKADKSETAALKAEFEKRLDLAAVQATASALVAGSAVTLPELLDRLGALVGRADDKSSRTDRDIGELKAAIASLVIELAKVAKDLDALPTRVNVLEQQQRDSTKRN